MGKPVCDMHDHLILVVESERTKHMDYGGRLIRGLQDYPMYVNPLAILSVEVYKLDLPELSTAEVLEYTSSTPVVSSRNYKQFICSGKKKNQYSNFVKAFVYAFVGKYCC